MDMSRDVDEEGWEYSFSFQKGFSWHGTHPWFHSFVRRRRWLRKRIRRKHHILQDKAHALNPDYFTIHVSRAKSPVSSIETSDKRASSAARSSGWGAKSWLDHEEELEIHDIPTLMKGLRKSAIDREKIVYLKTFLDYAGDELLYLADQVGDPLPFYPLLWRQEADKLIRLDTRHHVPACLSELTSPTAVTIDAQVRCCNSTS